MLELMITLIYIGGLAPTYMHYSEDEGWFMSVVNAALWPVDLGSWIAELIYDYYEGDD